MRRRLSRTMDPIIAHLRSLGWRMRETKSGYLVYPPDGSRAIAIHAEKGDEKRRQANIRAKLRRAGVDL